MNFRRARPLFDRLLWRSYAKSASAKLAAGGKIVIQTPRCACGVEAGPGVGMVRLRLALKEFDEVHRDFIDFLQFAEEVAAKRMRSCASTADKEMCSTVYCREDGDASISTMVFHECVWFDERGDVISEPAETLKRGSTAACVWEFGGVWMRDSRWGVKWNVTEVKVYDPVAAASVKVPHTASVPAGVSAPCMFTDEATGEAYEDHLVRPAPKRQRVECLFLDDDV